VAVYDWLVAPVIAFPPMYHWLPVVAEELSVVFFPWQKEEIPVIVGVPGLLILTEIGAVM
jgi:hypothetical protein